MKNRIWALIIKELLAVWRDKKSRFFLIGPPLIQLLIFSSAATLDVKNVPIGILNRDSGAESFELIQRFRGSPIFSYIAYLETVSEIAPFIDNQKGVMVVSIEPEFSKNLLARKQAKVQLILDGRKSNTSQILAGYASTIIKDYSNDISLKTGWPEPTYEFVPRNWYNPNLSFYWTNVPGLCGILTMLVSIIVTSLSVARERELGTFDQLLVSPLQPHEIMIGKTIPALIIGMLEGTVIVLAALFIFQIPVTGSFFTLYFGMFVFIFSVIGNGLFISSLAKTQQQAILGSFLFITPTIMLSGFASPIDNMPEWLQSVTYVNPLRYFLILIKGVFLKSMSFNIALTQIWPMAIIACVNLTFATWMFKRKLD